MKQLQRFNMSKILNKDLEERKSLKQLEQIIRILISNKKRAMTWKRIHIQNIKIAMRILKMQVLNSIGYLVSGLAKTSEI